MKDQYIAVAKPSGDEFKTSATARLYNSWCLEIGERYALLMRANKPETAVQTFFACSLQTREDFVGLSPHGCGPFSAPPFGNQKI